MFESLKKFEGQHAQKPKSDAAKSDVKVQPFPKQVNLGTVITGGSTTATVVTPKLAENAGRATMRAHAVNGIGWRTFSVVNAFAGHEAVPIAEQPLEVRFNPAAHGTLKTQLMCTITSEDGQIEEREIELEGQGVNPQVQVQDGAQPIVDIDGIDANKVETLRKRTGEASRRAAALARAQIRAVGAVQREVETFKKKPKSGISFMDLALLAVSIATAGVGGAVATALAPKLAKLVAGGAAKQLLSEGTDIAAASPKMFNAISEGIQSAFAETAGAGAKKAVTDLTTDEEEAREVENDGEYSSNARINFFEAQRDQLDAVGERYADTIARQETALQPLLRTDPDAAIEAMNKIEETCKEQKQEAHSIQSFATTAQWTAATAQSVAGKRERLDRNVKSSVTDFSKGYGVDPDKQYASGLIRIAVTLDGDDVRVTSAALDGLAQEVADRLASRPLLHARIPVRLVVSSERHKREFDQKARDFSDTRVWITRDESGTVNVKGRLPFRSDDAFFRSDEEGATRLCHDVLSKSLGEWGVKMVNTDDASGRS